MSAATSITENPTPTATIQKKALSGAPAAAPANRTSTALATAREAAATARRRILVTIDQISRSADTANAMSPNAIPVVNISTNGGAPSRPTPAHSRPAT